LFPYTSVAQFVSAAYQPNQPETLDYALVTLEPVNAQTTLSGWDPNDDITVGLTLYNISDPDNLPKQFASLSATTLYSSTADFQAVSGYVDHGSSGSGLFDENDFVRGVMNDVPYAYQAGVSGCSVGITPYLARFSKFSSIYSLIQGSIDPSSTSTGVPVITEFSPTLNSISVGQSTTLNWVVDNATNVSISPGIGNVSADGSQSVSPSATTTYTLTATNATGSATASTTVTVTAQSVPGDSPTGVIPQFGVGASFVTDFYVINSGGSSARFSIAFHDDNGNPVSLPFVGLGNLSTLANSIPPGGSGFYEAGTPTTNPPVFGSASVTSDPGITIQAVLRAPGFGRKLLRSGGAGGERKL